MGRPRALVLLLELLTLCITAGEWGWREAEAMGMPWRPSPGGLPMSVFHRDTGGVGASSDGGHHAPVLHCSLWIPGIWHYLFGDCELRGG